MTDQRHLLTTTAMRRFQIWIDGHRHQGTCFEDGSVAIRGRLSGREPELHGFDDVDEMLQELCLTSNAVAWIDPAAAGQERTSSIKFVRRRTAEGGAVSYELYDA